jgi:hypothetical protein
MLREDTERREGGNISVKDELEKITLLDDPAVITEYVTEEEDKMVEKCTSEQEVPEPMIAQEETQDQLITRLDTQYRALIDKYEDLLEMFNQTRKENQSREEVARHQVSLQEELSSSDYRVDMLDMLDISHDISYDMTSWHNDVNYETMTPADRLLDDNFNNNREMEEIHYEKKKIEKAEPKRDIIEPETKEPNMMDMKYLINAKDDYRIDERNLMDRYHATQYLGQNYFYETSEMKQKIGLCKSDQKHKIFDIVQNTNNDMSEEEQNDNDDGIIDDNMHDNKGAGRIDLQKFARVDTHYDFVPKFDNFSSEEHQEHASVSSGFSEEVVEAGRVDHDCQTDIVMLSKEALSYGGGNQEYKDIFTRMFAMLRHEISTN